MVIFIHQINLQNGSEPLSPSKSNIHTDFTRTAHFNAQISYINPHLRRLLRAPPVMYQFHTNNVYTDRWGDKSPSMCWAEEQLFQTNWREEKNVRFIVTGKDRASLLKAKTFSRIPLIFYLRGQRCW